MSYSLRKVQDASISNKKVLLRLDLDVPLEDGIIQDDTRLLAGFKTLEFLLKTAREVIICGHLGRPISQWQISDNKREINDENIGKSLLPVAKWLQKMLKTSDTQLESLEKEGFVGWKLGEKIYLLENTRFFIGEAENSPELSKRLASLADVFVNDAFAVCHRANASVLGVAEILQSFAGFRFQEEVEGLSKVLDNPIRPLIVIVGGAKISTKLPLVERMYNIADYILVGGKIAKEKEALLNISKEKDTKKSELIIARLNESEADISKESLEKFLKIIPLGKTIVWNGPVGFVEDSRYEECSRKIAETIAKARAYSVVGGGDTISFIKKLGLINQYSFVSTGGGAMLEFLAGEKLPGLEILNSP